MTALPELFEPPALQTTDEPAVVARLRALKVGAERAARALDFEQAEQLYEATYVLGQAASASELAAEGVAGLARVAHLRCDVDRTQSLYLQALQRLTDRERRSLAHVLDCVRQDGHARNDLHPSEDTHAESTLEIDRAITLLIEGQPGMAMAMLDVLAEQVSMTSPRRLSVVNHYRAVARLALDLPAIDVDNPIDAWIPKRETPSGFRDTLPANVHARATLDLLERIRRRDAIEQRALVIARSGALFRLGEKIVPLMHRPQLGRVLTVLVDARLQNPGEWVLGPRLVEFAWPGERMVAAAGKNRLHVAVATIRKLGLRPVLQSRTGAYRLSRDIGIIVVD